MIASDPNRRRAGIGRTLYERVFGDLAARGVRKVRAITWPGNRKSVAFHRQLGFRIDDGPGGFTIGAGVRHAEVELSPVTGRVAAVRARPLFDPLIVRRATLDNNESAASGWMLSTTSASRFRLPGVRTRPKRSRRTAVTLAMRFSPQRNSKL